MLNITHIREMQIKTTMRYHFTQSERLRSKSLQAINAGEGVEKGNPLTLLVGMQTSTATMENSVEIPLKTGNRTALCWAYTPRKPELKETRVPQCSLQHCL